MTAQGNPVTEATTLSDHDEVVTRTHANMFGYRGVTWDQRRAKFRARIGCTREKRGRWLGLFETAEAAARGYDEAARELFPHTKFFNFPLNEGEMNIVECKKDVCVSGHDLTVHGRIDARGYNACRLCQREAALRYKKRKLVERANAK